MRYNLLANDLDHILAHTEDLWKELRGQRLFMTGGTGFFGCWLLESFAWANDKFKLGASALVLTRDPDAFRRKALHLASNPAIQFHTGDVRSFEFPDGEYSHIIHAAVQGTRHVLDFALCCAAKKFLLTSSGAVYERRLSAYGKEKQVAEHLCAIYARQYGLETKVARGFAFVGPYLPLDAHFAIGNFIRDGLQGGPIGVAGDGTSYRSYLYAADLAIWLWTILFRGKTCFLFRGEVCCSYNVGSTEALTIADLARMVAQAFVPVAVVKIAKAAAPGQLAERYVPVIRQTELNLHQWITLPEGIRRTIRWHETRGEEK